jgi:Orsellinic acid/F9775 biosynthesis cluster protein D
MDWPERFDALDLVLVQPERVLICRREGCQYALQVNDQRVNDHLWQKHGVPKEKWKGLNAYIHSLHLPDPRTVPPHRDGLKSHPDLAVHPGYSCSFPCKHRTISRELFNRHLRDHHDIRLSRNDMLAEY